MIHSFFLSYYLCLIVDSSSLLMNATIVRAHLLVARLASWPTAQSVSFLQVGQGMDIFFLVKDWQRKENELYKNEGDEF